MFVIAGIVVFFGIVSLLIYNGLVGKKNEVENAWAGIDVQLTKRYDLIPNLVETVKQYMQHEKETLTNLTAMRAKAMGTSDPDKKVGIDNQISKGLGQIMVSVENYPDLKASSNMSNLQKSLNEVEEQLAASRRGFNAAVTAFNNGVQMFPSSIFANCLGYSRRELFITPEFKKKNIDIKSLF
jgi:LemA protein